MVRGWYTVGAQLWSNRPRLILLVRRRFEPFLGPASSLMCSFTRTLSRSMFTGRTVVSSGLLVPPGMLLGESRSFLKHRGRLAQQGCEVPCDLPRLICRPLGGGECRGSGATIAGGDLPPEGPIGKPPG
jgi:hypothetical protein